MVSFYKKKTSDCLCNWWVFTTKTTQGRSVQIRLIASNTPSQCLIHRPRVFLCVWNRSSSSVRVRIANGIFEVYKYFILMQATSMCFLTKNGVCIKLLSSSMKRRILRQRHRTLIIRINTYITWTTESDLLKNALIHLASFRSSGEC